MTTQFLTLLLAAATGLVLAGCDAPREPKPASKPAAAAPLSALIDINRASAGELMALKGIGEARARAIINGRPYARKDELVQRKIIPSSVYDDIKDQIVARQKQAGSIRDFWIDQRRELRQRFLPAEIA